jgi:hypothetical protein
MQGLRRFDFVAQEVAGAGIAGAGGCELVAERGQGLDASACAERVEPHEQPARGPGRCRRRRRGPPNQRVCLVADAGVAGGQDASAVLAL